MALRQWWSGRTGMERLDLYSRWPLYLLSASQPLLVLLVVGGQPGARPWGVAVLLVVSVAHTVCCLALLRAGIALRLGAPRPVARAAAWAGASALALTAAGLAAGAAAFPDVWPAPEGTDQPAIPAGVGIAVLFGGALTAAATPLLRLWQVIAVVLGSAAATGFWQAVVAVSDEDQPPWAVTYVVYVAIAAFTYRSSVWYLGITWQVDRAREVQARLAVAEERVRLARDLHDVLGRNLALIAVNSELAARWADRGRDADAAERMLDVRRVAQESMREMRDVVGGLRATDLDTELSGARSVLRSAGIDVRVVGDASHLRGAAQETLGWVVREAVTNILRHSAARTVTIALDTDRGQDPSATVLRVENDGAHPPGPGGSGTGSGLRGLRERLSAAGGKLAADWEPGDRFVVRAVLPLATAVPRPVAPEEVAP